MQSSKNDIFFKTILIIRLNKELLMNNVLNNIINVQNKKIMLNNDIFLFLDIVLLFSFSFFKNKNMCGIFNTR